jgi:hypothetical protein
MPIRTLFASAHVAVMVGPMTYFVDADPEIRAEF